MDVLKEWCNDQQMAEAIYQNLQCREAQLPVYYCKSPQIHQRRSLVDWLAQISDTYDLCPEARQLAVTLMDYFMDNYDIESHLIKLVAIGSLLVAGKFEEKEENLPKSKTLNSHLPAPGYQAWEYLRMELILLEFFDWRIAMPTPAHFTQYLLAYSISPTDCHLDRPIHNCERVKEFVRKYNNYFLEITLQDEYYRSVRPSLVAAACVVSSRICLKITPKWSKQLEKISNYTWDNLNGLTDRMLQTFSVDEEAQRRKNSGNTVDNHTSQSSNKNTSYDLHDSAGNSPYSDGSPASVTSSYSASSSMVRTPHMTNPSPLTFSTNYEPQEVLDNNMMIAPSHQQLSPTMAALLEMDAQQTAVNAANQGVTYYTTAYNPTTSYCFI